MVVILESNLVISSKVEESISNNQTILLPGTYPETLSLSSCLEDGQDLEKQNKTKKEVQRVWKTENSLVQSLMYISTEKQAQRCSLEHAFVIVKT